MSQLEYLVALISIIIGLALADMLQSVRELVRPDRAVRWHWLPLLWATTVFLLVLQFWWASFGVLQGEIFGHVLGFLPFLLMFLVLYLICAFALPDPDWESSPASGLDSETASEESSALSLKTFYFSAAHRRWFFGAFIALLILNQVVNISFSALSTEMTLNALDRARGAFPSLLSAGLLFGLIVSRRWWLHATVAVLFFAAIVYALATQIPPLG
ncbi:hypothetical protein [Salinibacter grassmerensis]|uniref:hypothetical protein n=1 Tax=Salinibacter grassmerensis TaxID=3040353 RepID=UPI0021E8CD7A|nr:hypothetical protein [Salinibacter grassmerensis]